MFILRPDEITLKVRIKLIAAVSDPPHHITDRPSCRADEDGIERIITPSGSTTGIQAFYFFRFGIFDALIRHSAILYHIVHLYF